MSETDTIAEDVARNLADVREAIAKAARAIDRDPSEVTLVAVSKQHDPARIQAAIDAGQRVFGENRVQEAQGKFPALKECHPDLELHLLGPLQSNKAEDAVALFDVIESVDRPKIARALAKEMDRQNRRPELFIQVNTGEEPQKAGVVPGELDALVHLCRDELSLPVVGLMCIPPIEEEPAPHFALLAKLAAEHGFERLSMGMSHDFETAVKLGATHVRVGTAIFGQRPKP
ncbi:YggS family pyridoxal phosphate-dependent enzyme [Ferruginivarius sediminum]|uniref:Pyridoxal phosphate homeostasis protein n=1 Tax=Ferruginivarius sediminum TaxID=2661937 RepID=A0A369TD85_9PROT|nr:YggS family pyridoxal phosphate-dependent enzyme [Ferruginivarius sediminum]RDD63248.1 YggS family pyridoxal phosphate-dependent enzyme [Ferruginivarius sediminum]